MGGLLQLYDAHRASKVFSQHLLERRHIHQLLSQQLLQLGILNLKRLQLLLLKSGSSELKTPNFFAPKYPPSV